MKEMTEYDSMVMSNAVLGTSMLGLNCSGNLGTRNAFI